MLDSKGFDIWSEEYDKYVERNSKGYPFEGYYDVLNYMYNLIEKKESVKILDIGVGTGILTNQLYKDGAEIYGVDFSKKMIEIAQEKMPKAKFIQWDFNLGIPSELKDKKFNYIISSYAIHHLNDDKKLEFIKQLKNILTPGGKIIIADIAFQTSQDFLICKKENADGWDEDEVYIAADEMKKRLTEIGIRSTYQQISSCAGILQIY